MSSLPLKMNGNTVSQDPTHLSQFPHQHEENVVLPKTAGESMGGGCPASTAVEDRLDKVHLEILKKKTTVNPSLPQEDKTNQVGRMCLSCGAADLSCGWSLPEHPLPFSFILRPYITSLPLFSLLPLFPAPPPHFPSPPDALFLCFSSKKEQAFQRYNKLSITSYKKTRYKPSYQAG